MRQAVTLTEVETTVNRCLVVGYILHG